MEVDARLSSLLIGSSLSFFSESGSPNGEKDWLDWDSISERWMIVCGKRSRGDKDKVANRTVEETQNGISIVKQNKCCLNFESRDSHY